MATIKAAITAVATFGASVPGITKSYDVDALPESLDKGVLPCALVFPDFNTAWTYDTQGFGNGHTRVKFRVEQLFLYTLVANKKTREAMPALLTLVDSFSTSFNAAPLLNSDLTTPAIHAPAKIDPLKIDGWSYGDKPYWGFLVAYTLEVQLG